MHPLSIALGFMFFWLVTGLGLFLFSNNLVGLWRRVRINQETGIIAVGIRKQALLLGFNLVLVLAGLAMMLYGGYATYMVIYH